MKRLPGLVFGVPLVLAATAAMAQDADLEARIAETQDRYAEAWTGGDADALAELFTEDAVYWPPSGGMHEGVDDIRTQFEQEFEQQEVPESVEITSEHTEEIDGLIVDVGTFSATMPEEAGGEMRGEYMVLAEEAEDGVRIRRLIGFPRRQAPQHEEGG